MGTVQEQGRSDLDEAPIDVELLFFTDPFSSWCWAAEPIMLRMREQYGHVVHFRTVLGGLVESAAPMLEDPARLEWLRQHLHEVMDRSGQPIDPAFLDDMEPSFSTWPACIHIKAAEAQTEDFADRLLRRMRIGIMTRRENPSDVMVATKLVDEIEGLEQVPWQNAITDGTALSAFMADRHLCAQYNATGFPSIVVRTSGGNVPRTLVGFRAFPEVERYLLDCAPGLSPREPREVPDILFDIGPMTTREIQEVQAWSPRDTMEALEMLEGGGQVKQEKVAGGTFWSLTD